MQEQQLVAQILLGNAQAYRELYEQYVGRVYSICYRLLADVGLAEDATQEVFVTIWKKIASFRGESNLGSWINQIATRLAIDFYRKQKTWLQRFFHHDDLIMNTLDPLSEPNDGSDLESAITGLPAKARIIFVLFAIEGYSHQEISYLLKVSTGTCKAQYHRARQLLQQRLNETNA